jgi:hypothetical protein
MRNPATSRPTAPFSDDVKALIIALLSDLPPVEFVASRNEVVKSANGSPGSVKSGASWSRWGR